MVKNKIFYYDDGKETGKQGNNSRYFYELYFLHMYTSGASVVWDLRRIMLRKL